MERPSSPDSDFAARPARQRLGEAKRRLRCLLVPPPRGSAELSRALVRCLSEEMPDVRFSLHAEEPADAVWVCGDVERAVRILGGLRVLYPQAVIVVTGRAPALSWEKQVRAAGADFACDWPADYALLNRLLHSGQTMTETGEHGPRALN